jgi:hypothetical protein
LPAIRSSSSLGRGCSPLSVQSAPPNRCGRLHGEGRGAAGGGHGRGRPSPGRRRRPHIIDRHRVDRGSECGRLFSGTPGPWSPRCANPIRPGSGIRCGPGRPHPPRRTPSGRTGTPPPSGHWRPASPNTSCINSAGAIGDPAGR